MYIGTKRDTKRTMALWLLSFGLYGIYWVAKNLDEIKANRGKGISGKAYAIAAILFPPLSISACWLLPSSVGKLYTENGKLEQINSCWGAMLFLPSIALWLVSGMLMLIVQTGGTGGIFGDNQVMGIGIIAFVTMAMNVGILYNWMTRIQDQLNNFWDDASGISCVE